MEKKVSELKERYGEEIRQGLKKLSEEMKLQGREREAEDLGTTLEEAFNIWDMKEYGEYMDILEEIERYKPRLAARLEEYLVKEVNLVALLGFHMGRMNAGAADENR